MSPTVQYEETIDGDTIITYKKAGISSSAACPRSIWEKRFGRLERLIPIQVGCWTT